MTLVLNKVALKKVHSWQTMDLVLMMLLLIASCTCRVVEGVCQFHLFGLRSLGNRLYFVVPRYFQFARCWTLTNPTGMLLRLLEHSAIVVSFLKKCSGVGVVPSLLQLCVTVEVVVGLVGAATKTRKLKSRLISKLVERRIGVSMFAAVLLVGRIRCCWKNPVQMLRRLVLIPEVLVVQTMTSRGDGNLVVSG